MLKSVCLSLILSYKATFVNIIIKLLNIISIVSNVWPTYAFSWQIQTFLPLFFSFTANMKIVLFVLLVLIIIDNSYSKKGGGGKARCKGKKKGTWNNDNSCLSLSTHSHSHRAHIPFVTTYPHTTITHLNTKYHHYYPHHHHLPQFLPHFTWLWPSPKPYHQQQLHTYH